MKKPGRKPTGRVRVPLNITITQRVKDELNQRAFRSNVSISEWIEGIVKKELGITEEAKPAA